MALRTWVRQAEVDAGRGRPRVLTTDEREGLARLRRDAKRLQMERDVLDKCVCTAFEVDTSNANPTMMQLPIISKLKLRAAD
ncbi:MAG: hypothetical protein U0807_12115 [Candidatus Binatia bacterium]